MGIFDYFTPEARRGNRQALEGLLMQFIPPEMRPQLNLLAELNPIVSMERAGQDAQQLFAPDQTLMDRLAAGGRMASNMAGVVAPAMVAGRAGVPVANAVQDVLTGYAPMVQPFMADEFGGVGFKAYHGSPHSFDKFSMDKIGTGEGAQAYGHGLYFADKEAVAKGYQTNNSAVAAMKYNGKPITDEIKRSVAWYLEQNGGNKDAVLEQWRGMYRPDHWDTPLGKRELRALEAMDPAKLKAGNMYEVQINADPEKFLDSDLPLNKQPQSVRDALQPVIAGMKDARMNEFDRKAILSGKASGADLYGALKHSAGGADAFDRAAAATEAIRSKGIPGIKYLDAGSRTAGDGSRNYVVFDENLISIVRKYGIAGAAAMLGMSQADVAQAMGQQPQGLLESGPQ